MSRVLVVEDEPAIAELIAVNLRHAGFEAALAADAAQARASVDAALPDLVVLDWMLPKVSGIEVCRRLRARPETRNLPILMLTARGEEGDRVRGLDTGADDYMVKPFSPRELVARVRALLRRPKAPRSSAPASGLEVDTATRRVTVDGREVHLTNIEFAVLEALARDPGVVLSRTQLLESVWGSNFVGDDHVLDVHVGNLRRKLGDDSATPRFVETVRGIGFRLVPT